VGVCTPNVPEYAVVFHGVSLAGGINTTLNPRSPPDELAAQLRHTRAPGHTRRVSCLLSRQCRCAVLG
jgi:acyl-CoA synthetase (AMP-forming)/AMP-acid ligase II